LQRKHYKTCGGGGALGRTGHGARGRALLGAEARDPRFAWVVG